MAFHLNLFKLAQKCTFWDNRGKVRFTLVILRFTFGMLMSFSSYFLPLSFTFLLSLPMMPTKYLCFVLVLHSIFVSWCKSKYMLPTVIIRSRKKLLSMMRVRTWCPGLVYLLLYIVYLVFYFLRQLCLLSTFRTCTLLLSFVLYFDFQILEGIFT